MKVCPPWPDIEMMLTIEPGVPVALHHLGRFLHQEERRAHVDGEHASKSSGLVSQMVPRSVIAAALTRTSTLAEGVVRRRDDHAPGVLDLGEVGLDVERPCSALRLERRR